MNLGDLRFAARSLRRSPGFGRDPIVSLVLGLELTTSTLSVMLGEDRGVSVEIANDGLELRI